LYDWGSHLVDQIWKLLSPAKPIRVFAQLRGNVWSSDCDDFARLLIDFDSGVAALVEINTTTHAPLPRWQIDGSNGSASSPTSLKYDGRVWSDLTFSPASGPSRKLELAPPGLDESAIWEQFSRAVYEGKQPAVDARSVLMTMQLLDAARSSSREGRAVAVNSIT
jgi:predicted dehydrogenase